MSLKKYTLIILISFIGLALATLFSLSMGARAVPVGETIEAIFKNQKDQIHHIVVHERIPRTIFGLMAGMALGISGAIMQAITRNPIADPSILGVNTGASLSVVVGIAFFSIGTAQAYIWFAIFGAAITAIFVYGIGSMGSGGATPIKLALAGAATSAALSSLVSAVVLPRTDVMNLYRFWQVGSLSGATWEGIMVVLPFLAVGMAISFILAPSLDILALGDELATGLGIKTSTIRLLGALAGVLLTGATTALAGPIGFVGLMIPHIVRLVVGSSLKLVLPISAIGGSSLLLFADVAGRLLGRPSELEAGIVTAFIGAPILIMIARKTKVKLI
jgi:iron complex transport system permease protein